MLLELFLTSIPRLDYRCFVIVLPRVQLFWRIVSPRAMSVPLNLFPLSIGKMKNFLLTGLALLVFAMFALVLVSLYLAKSTGSRVAQKRQAIVNAGDKVYLSGSAGDLIPADENGMAQFESAVPDLRAFEEDYAKLAFFSNDLNYKLGPKQIADLEKIIAKYPAMFVELDRAAACTQFVDLSENDDVALDAFGDMHMELRVAAKAFSAKALVAAYQGKGDEALQACEAALNLRPVASVRPCVFSCLVDVAVQGIIFNTANQVLQISTPTPEAIAQFKNRISSIDNVADFTDAIKGERAFGLSMIKRVQESSGDGGSDVIPGGAVLLGNWLGEAYLNDDEEKYMDLMAAHIDLIGQRKKLRDPVLKKIEDDLRTIKFRHALSKMMVPTLDNAHDAVDRIEAQLRCMRMICDHSLTSSNASVVPAAKPELDPYTGKNLKSKSTATGWLVYSVGENLIDDGGTIVAKDLSSHPLDTGFGPLLLPLTASEPEASEPGVVLAVPSES